MTINHDPAKLNYDFSPALFLLGDDQAALNRAEDIGRASGARINRSDGLAAATAKLNQQIAPDGVVLCLERDHGASGDQLLDALDQAADEGRFASVVVAPPACLDAVAARLTHNDVILLSEPSQLELASAIGDLIQPREQALNDARAIGQYGRLQMLSEEVERIARTLASLSSNGAAELAPAMVYPMAEQNDGVIGGPGVIDPAAVRAIIRARRLREQFFASEIFADPAWDMLLDLLAARLEGRQVSVSSLCIAAAVPPTTALRWIKALTDSGLFIRIADPHDRRRVFIALSDTAADAVANCVAAMRRITAMTG
jgi:hypothetical protein